MKAVQIGILAALILCAGLLYRVYRGQQPAPAPATAQTAATSAPAQPAAATPPAAPPAEAAPVAEPPREEPSPRKPSPSRRRERPAVRQTVAQVRPADPAPAPAAQLPSPAPAAQSVPAPSQPEQPAPAESQPAAGLNPPAGTETAPPAPPTPHTVTIPGGTLIQVRLGQTLSSEKNQAGDTFSATLDQPLEVDGFVIAERGARVQGKVLEAERAGRLKGVAMLAIALTRLHTSDGQDVQIQTERFAKEGPSSKADDAKKVGVGAAIGAAIGAIAGGGKGAAIGAGVGAAGGGGAVAVTRGKPAELAVETRVSFRLQNPVTLTEHLQ